MRGRRLASNSVDKSPVAKLDELSLCPRAQSALWKERTTFRELSSDSTYVLWRAPEYTHAHTHIHPFLQISGIPCRIGFDLP